MEIHERALTLKSLYKDKTQLILSCVKRIVKIKSDINKESYRQIILVAITFILISYLLYIKSLFCTILQSLSGHISYTILVSGWKTCNQSNVFQIN